LSAGRILWIFLGLSTLARLLFAGACDLKVEEAYYWNYAQHPDLSYFDHPPLTALLIGIATAVGGAHPFWVRVPAVLLFAASSWLLYDTVRRLSGPRPALLSALLLAVLPTFSVHSLFILPDSPLLFCWCLGMWAGWRLVESGDNRWWWLVGLATGLGMDAKYPAVLIPLALFLYLGRRAWCLPMLGAATLAIALFSPVIAWNALHGWASIRFQGAERMHEAVSWTERAGSWLFQLGMLSPVGFIAIIWALVAAFRRRDAGSRYLLAWSLPFLLLMVVVSMRRLVQINWPMPGYVGATALLAIALVEAWSAGRRLVPLVLGGGTLLGSLLLSSIPWLVAFVPIPALNRADDVNGWRQLALQLRPALQEMPRPRETFLAGHGYQVASEMAFTLGLPHRVLANNVLGNRALAYDFWERPEDFRGWDALYVVYSQPTSSGSWRERVGLDPEQLKSRFERVEEPEVWTSYRGRAPLRRYHVYRCFGYRGPTDR